MRKTLDPTVLMLFRCEVFLCVVAEGMVEDSPAGEDLWLEGPVVDVVVVSGSLAKEGVSVETVPPSFNSRTDVELGFLMNIAVV